MKALLVHERESFGPEAVSLPGGEAVAITFRCPDKAGPNEDAAVVVPLGDGAVLAVADGVGGSRSAHLASAAVTRALAALDDGGRSDVIDAVELANRQILESSQGAATTVAIAQIEKNTVRPIHVGDSTVILVGQRGRLHMQTVPHSPVGYALEAGMIDEGEAMHHADRHIVSNVIGAEDMRIEIGGSLTMARRDTLILATDGVLDNLHLDELIDFVRVGPIAKAAQRVADVVSRRMREPQSGVPSKPDDTTMILYRRNS